MSLEGRVESLARRHENLETRIVEETGRPSCDEDMVRALKVEKLRVKDELERMRA
jgi:hypothetical protein